jgi:polyphosphate:AMP phosphotransferase
LQPPPRLSDAESGQRVSKEELHAAEPALRVDLINAQYDLKTSGHALLVVITGDDRAGCEALVDRLHEWLDARYVELHVFPALEADPPGQPLLWKYWCVLPRHGRSAIFMGAWAWRALVDRVERRLDDAELEQLLARLASFERSLVDSGIRLVKLWLHQSRAQHEKRLKKAREDPDSVWDVEDEDRRILRSWKRGLRAAERVIAATHAEGAQWTVIESGDPEYRDLVAAQTVLAALRAPDPAPLPVALAPFVPRQISDTDPPGPITEADADARLEQLQARLARLSRKARRKGLGSVVVLEGPDAAGKGGAIRRLIRAMAARDYTVVPISAPTEEELAHPYLWRFWTRLPGPGRMTIFDRSWYGRVLVERVEGLATPEQWTRAYGEICSFEAELLSAGLVLCKFWLAIDREEQLRRFREREQTPYKKYKIGPDDYRNRGKWDEYTAAAEEMLARTDRDGARWQVIPANDKPYARVRVLECVCEALERGLASRTRRAR